MSISAGWVSVADADKWMRSQPSAREAMCGAQLQV